MIFADAVKDVDTGVDAANDWLAPRQVELPDGKFGLKSKVHIFWDKCPELIHQLENVRFESQTAMQAEKSDPLAKQVNKRNHLTDCFRYGSIDKTEHVEPPSQEPRPKAGEWQPMSTGMGY